MFGKLKKPTVVSIYKPVEFPVINNYELAHELNVEVLAKQAARLNKPSTDSILPDSNELNFKQDIETKGLQAAHRVNQSVADLRDALMATSVTKEISEAEEMPNKYKNIIAARLPAAVSSLKDSCANCRIHSDHINHFKKENNLQRNANFPTSMTLTVGLLLMAWIIESVLNGVFFAEGSDTGLVGGVGLACVISGFNIITGFINGLFVLRYKNHVSNVKVTLAYCSFIIISSVVFVFNILVSHYREALGNDPDNARNVAVESFKEGMLAISDIESWLLFAIGMVFYILAIYKGYSADDEYPGFGKMTRIRDRLEDELTDYKEELILEFDELLAEYEERLEELYEIITNKSKQVNTYISSFDAQKLIFQSYKRHLQSSYEYISKLYRDINSMERDDSPPVYFNDPATANLDNDNMSIEYVDNRNEIVEKKNVLAQTIHKIKSEMHKCKEDFQIKINKASQL